MKASFALSSLILILWALDCRAREPSIEDVVRNPADYAGKAVMYNGVTLSGAITPEEVSGVRKYYLTVQTPDRTYEAGFFLAPPGLADKLSDRMSPRKNYAVNISCKVEKISINGFEQWHGIVAAVAFLDSDGKVTETVKVDKK
jgi:hypothetical protein